MQRPSLSVPQSQFQPGQQAGYGPGPGSPQQQSASHPTRECETCGAPPLVGLAACSYCKTAYAGIQAGLRCPQCSDMNLVGSVACATCRTSLAIGCVFCGAPSPLDRPACVRCGEAFAGAVERRQARDSQAQQAQYVGLATEGVRVLGSVVSHAPSGTGSAILDALGGIFEEVTK